MSPRKPDTSTHFEFALKLTSFGAQFGLTGAVGLAFADIASQFVPKHPALAFGVVGGTAAVLAWGLFGRLFNDFGRTG